MAIETFTKTGEGSQALAAFKTVTSVSHNLSVVSSQVQQLSAVAPIRVMHAGWWGVVINVATPSTRQVLWWKYVELVIEAYKVALNGGADGIIWHLAPGCTLVMSVGP
jgi:uncharacterized membrane protein YpjA